MVRDWFSSSPSVHLINMEGYNIRWGAAVKPGETNREDAHRLHDLANNGGLAAIADGAGGKGVFVGKWAQTLLNHLPETPFEHDEAFKSWFAPVAVEFFKTHKADAQQYEHTWTKFLQEGSAATLSALWLPNSHDRTSPFTALVYGDSPMMRYRFDGKTLQMPEHLPTLSSFSYKTPLLNWSAEYPFNPNHCHIHSFHPENELVLLATDALAQLILIRYLLSKPDEEPYIRQLKDAEAAGGIHAQLITANRMADLPVSFDEWLRLLLNTLKTNPQEETDEFKNLLYRYFEQGLIEEDDYTLIALEIPSALETQIGFPTQNDL